MGTVLVAAIVAAAAGLAARSIYKDKTVSYTHLTLPTNREV